MTKQKLLRTVSAVALGFTMVTGVGVAGASSHHWSHGSGVSTTIHNDNDVKVKNDNDQWARTGDAEVERNDEGGDATTGDAKNKNSLGASVSIDNGSCGCADDSAALVGDDEGNSVKVTTKVTNDNDVHVTNDNDQHATSGDATVEHNDEGGSATTGDAVNENAATISVTITN